MSAERLTWEQAVVRLQADPDRQAQVRDSYYDPSVETAARRFADSEEWRATRAWFPYPVARAVDLGAGRGIASYALARDGWEVTAVEPDPGDVVGRGAISALCRATGVSVAIADGFAECIPLPDASCRLVYGRAVLHHTRDMRRACAEVARVLEPGGRFVAVREHVIGRPEERSAFLAQHELHALYGGEDAFPLSTYTEAIESAGLRLERVIGPFESVANYAPYSREDVWGICCAPLIRLVGWWLARFLAGSRHVAGRCLQRALARRASRRDDRPGRLYSFVSEKR